jgi:hypothetical protein
VVDADGHILEPLDLWDTYIDPEFRERRPRFVIDENVRNVSASKVSCWAIHGGLAAWVPSASGKGSSRPAR